MNKEIRFYRTLKGEEPFIQWIKTIKDRKAIAQIQNRLERVLLGNYGDYKAVGGGIYELRIHYGPGYRLYFSEYENVIVLILIGGIKGIQKRDILKTKEYWQDFKERIYEKQN